MGVDLQSIRKKLYNLSVYVKTFKPEHVKLLDDLMWDNDIWNLLTREEQLCINKYNEQINDKKEYTYWPYDEVLLNSVREKWLKYKK